MCVAAAPLLMIQTAMSVAGAVMSYVGQQQQAKKQERAVMDSYNSQTAQLQEQRRQQNVEAQQQMSERGRQALFERARLRAASAEGGTGGNSVDRIFGAADFQAGQDVAMMQENARNVSRQSALEGQALHSQAQSRLNTIERPSLLNTGLQIAGIGMDSYNKYQKIKAPTKTG